MKSAKSHLLKSALAMLLCISMLVSSTFAWFTDQVSTKANIITSGNLDLEMYWTDDLASGTWYNVEEAGYNTIFSYDNWEPGYTEVKYIKLVNAGELALNYDLAIEAQTGVGKLAEVISVYFGEGAIPMNDRADLGQLGCVGFLNNVMNGGATASGTLLPADAYNPNHPSGEVIMTVAMSMITTAGNEYQNESSGDFTVRALATQAPYESDSFGSDYDSAAELPTVLRPGSVSVPVTAVDGKVPTGGVNMAGDGLSAFVPEGTALKDGADKLTLTVTPMEDTTSGIVAVNDEILIPVDVHVEGVAEGNTVPVVIDLGAVLPKYLNMGNYRLIHVEDGVNQEMTRVSAKTDLVAHNQFTYDPATGEVTVAMASFSEIALLSATLPVWEGKRDYTWYDAAAAELTIVNGDQLAGLSAIVGGMDSQPQDTFSGKTVKLASDINLGDIEKENNPNVIFYPIGYYNNEGTYEKTNTAITSGLRNFEGTFDGQGHTISNFYHNTWEMKGDHDWYAPEEQYYRDGMGLFGRVYKGTVKNLTVSNFSSDGEIATTGCIAAYAEGATFENIAITNCNPRVYNIGNGGIVGCVGWYAKEAGLKTTFTNITVDNSNKISALWGSYDVACGGIVGQYYPTSGQTSANKPANGGIDLVNCHVSAQMDVYNDVCGNYQYYAYRYAGMIIGSVRENTTTVIDGVTKTIPDMTGISAKNCTVNYGDWNDYYYCEFQKNGHPSYSGPDDYKFSRVPDSELNFTDSNGNGKVDANERASVTGCKHNHEPAEDNQAIYLPFHQLFTGYGWGVNSIGLEKYSGITVEKFGLGIEEGDQEESVEKFSVADNPTTVVMTGSEHTVEEFFKQNIQNSVAIDLSNVQVFASPADENSSVSLEYTADTADWTKGTLKFYGRGTAIVTITDYKFCTPCTISVDIASGTLYRVGNQNTVTYNQIVNLLTKQNKFASIEVTQVADAIQIKTRAATDTVQFNGTGIAFVKIDGATYPVEVVDAKNVTSLSGTLDSSVVLLNDCGISSVTVSGRNTIYGNGFKCTYTGNGQYLNNGLKQGVITVSQNATLDNLRIEASIYPTPYLYYDEVRKGPSSEDGDKIRYYYQLSAVVASENATISNCYIYGGRNNIFVNTGNVTIKDSVLECGTLANVQIQSNSSHTVTFENVTTIQHQVNATIGDLDQIMLGAGIIVGPETSDNPTIVLKGEIKQYNWVTAADADAIENSTAKTIINTALATAGFNHTVNGQKSSNLGIIFLNEYDVRVTNETTLPYNTETVTMMGQKGQVCSLQGATEDQIHSDYVNADRTTENSLYKPQFKYSADLGGQLIPETEDGDEFCFRESDTIKVLFPAGETKELDLAGLVEIKKYSGHELKIDISCKDEQGKTVNVSNGTVSLSAAGKYTVTYTVTDDAFYDEDGNSVDTESPRKYVWTVTVDVALKDTALPNAYFKFDATKQKMGYYKPAFGDVKQYLPFLAGLKIYDYNGQTEYLRFDGSSDFSKVASITITGYSSNKAAVEVKLTDGGVINTQFLARANSGGGSTYTGKIKTSNNTIYFVTDSGTSNKDATTTAAYWYVDYYKFTGNNGVEIQSAQQTFNSTGSSASTPSGSFNTTIKYTVTYDANGGNCGQSMGYATSASAAVTLPTPARSGYILAGWYTAASGGTRVGGAGDTYTPNANITLYAQWGKPCTVTYNANGGSCGTASQKYTGAALTLPTPTRDGYWFVGWYDAATGGKKIGDAGTTYNPAGEITLYAHWQEKIEYTVTYNANGGTCGTASATYQGTALTLPTPTRTGYKFLGWYTAASGGTKVGDAGAGYTPSANITLYAQWEQISYTITISKQNNATVTVDKTTAHYNDTISVTVSFSQNNSKTLTVKDASGNTVLSKSAAGTYTFTMPASNVTIEASSSGSCVTPDTLITLADGTQKRINQTTYEDLLLVWNFQTGKYDVAPASIVMNHGYNNYTVVTLAFEDGTIVNTINGHGFFDVATNEYVIINESNVADLIGHEFVQVDGNGYTTVRLVDYDIRTEYTESWSVLTAAHYNCILEDMWTLTPAEVEGSPDYLMPFYVDEDMKYDAAQMQADIEKYGLYSYEEFSNYMTYEQFTALGVANFKVAVGKGYFTHEDILFLISIHLG